MKRFVSLCSILGTVWAALAVPAVAYINLRPPLELKELLNTSEVVAEVWISAGDATACYGMVYRAEVIAAVKGTTSGEIVYFSVDDRCAIGQRYFVFLHRVKPGRSYCPKPGEAIPWSGVKPDVILSNLEPFGAVLPVESTSSLPGEDHGVRIGGMDVLIPPEIAVSRDHGNPEINRDLWAREQDFLKVLKVWAKPK